MNTQKLLDDYVAGQGKSMKGLGFSREMARKELLRRGDAFQALVAVTEKFLDLCPRMNEDDPVAPAIFNACEQALAALKLARDE